VFSREKKGAKGGKRKRGGKGGKSKNNNRRGGNWIGEIYITEKRKSKRGEDMKKDKTSSVPRSIKWKGDRRQTRKKKK